VRLKDRLKAEIAASGPMSVAEYMGRCLHDPADGYYATRAEIGAEGDFVTAPAVSQMFGELIGLWAAETWRRMGRPSPVLLVEIGAGDGTLLADALRAARLVPAFLQALDLRLIEPSDRQFAQQAERLAAHGPRRSRTLSDLPDGPAIVIGNEVLDCLPARQFVRTDRGWTERRIGLDAAGELAFGLQPSLPPPGAPADLAPGLVWEVSPAQAALGGELGARVAGQGGCALLLDYGRARPEPGDTLQAVARHRKLGPLDTPGEADLTVWADFPAVAEAARAAGAAVSGPLEQGTFLRRLGIEHRAAALARARPDQADALARQLERLVSPSGMGTLFKALAVHHPTLAPPGFEEAA
jgi:SAM-dependent MidA family methyltransferase